MHTALSKLPGIADSFLGRRLHQEPKYGFLPHYLYFLENCDRWTNASDIQRRILASVPSANVDAWQAWKQFRSAQAEVTSIYLVEAFLGGRVQDLEVSRPGFTKSCDMTVHFGDEMLSYVEVKAQSGQQHGSKHPLTTEEYMFTPQGEEDLCSWLFEHKISATSTKPMVPYCHQAADKGADVLLAMLDIMLWDASNLGALGETLVPDYKTLCRHVISKKQEVEAVVEGQDRLPIWKAHAGVQTTTKMAGLKEVWLYKESAHQFLAIRAEQSCCFVANAIDA